MECIRKLNCDPLSQTVSDCKSSFICVGYNDESTRKVEQDVFCHCWKNSEVDEYGNWDKRDIIDTVAVMTTALSIDANYEAAEGK